MNMTDLVMMTKLEYLIFYYRSLVEFVDQVSSCELDNNHNFKP